jgi:hypothetical protein
MPPGALSLRRSTLVALARVANALFFLAASLYCLLTYSSFAYQQFIRPHLVSWLTGFVAWHHLAFWLVLIVTAWTLLPELGRGRGRWIARGYLAVWSAIGILLIVKPVLPQVENNGRGLVLALAALLPPIWLAIFDHVRYQHEVLPRSSEGRLLKAALVACAAVWSAQAIVIPWRLNQTGEVTLSLGALGFGVATSAIAHLFVFSVLAFALLASLRLGRAWRASGPAERRLLVVLAIAVLTMVVNRLVLGAIAFSGLQAWLVSVTVAVALALVWSGASHAIVHDRQGAFSAIEAWLTPIPGVRSRTFCAGALVGLVFLQVALLAYVATFDWDFVVQKLCVLVVWCLAFAYAFGRVSPDPEVLTWRAIAAVPAAAVLLLAGSAVARERVPGWIDDPTFVPAFALEGYVAVDPSYRVIHDALRVESREQAAFYAHLRAFSLIQHVPVPPIDIDFAEFQTHPSKSGDAEAPKPNIFLFVIDSLRRDYLSPYNPAVHFTPSIDEFAKDSVVFERAFTRYGGTGLAVPAIWAGGMLLHKQYVTPFDPMNALLKMLEADKYRRLMSMDSVAVQLIAPPPAEDELDRGVPVMKYRLCSTLEDLRGKLTGSRIGKDEARPVFVYALPQDLHISHIRSRPVRAEASYPGFLQPVAAQVEEMDACFGRFIRFLKEQRLYDDSVIVITSDHGDSLGESLRWGHSYTMFPEVARIPLIVRVPERVRRHLTVDPGAVALSTDLTPTFYVLAGHEPKDLGPLYGRPLFVPAGAAPTARRTEPQVITSSYGAVYAVLRDNGTRLYIADGVNERDYAYRVGSDVPARVGVTGEERRANQTLIRQYVDEIARLYRFVPAS